MDLMTPDDDVLAPLIAEAQAKLEAALAERPALAAESQATRRAHEDADNVFQNFVLRVNLATRRGADLVGSALMRLVDDERRKRDLVAGAATLARQRLANLDWTISLARTDLDQLELVRNPPSAADYRPIEVEVVKRPAPQWIEGFDPIEWPPGTKPAAAA
jgi:hypothetical protein